MSLEAALAANTEALTAHTEVMKAVVANQERLLAGQQAAIEKIEAPKATRARTKDEPSKETKAEPVKETKVEPVKAAADTTDDDIKAAAAAWTNGASQEARMDAACKMKSVLEHFGVGGKLTGPESKLDADMRKQTVFFIKRWAAGLPVDFNADYDFDGDPKQGAAEAASDDLLG